MEIEYEWVDEKESKLFYKSCFSYSSKLNESLWFKLSSMLASTLNIPVKYYELYFLLFNDKFIVKKIFLKFIHSMLYYIQEFQKKKLFTAIQKRFIYLLVYKKKPTTFPIS